MFSLSRSIFVNCSLLSGVSTVLTSFFKASTHLEEYFKDLTEESKKKNITWHSWGSIEINKENKVKRCVSCVPKENNIESFLAEMMQDLEVYPGHIFRARWQQKQMTNCIGHLKLESIAMVMDFRVHFKVLQHFC
jgi:hypothetical protein